MLIFGIVFALAVILAVLLPVWSEQSDTRETPVENWTFTQLASEIFDSLAVDAKPLTAPRSTVEIVDLRTGEIVSRFGVVSHVRVEHTEHGTYYACAHRPDAVGTLRGGKSSDRGAWLHSVHDRRVYLGAKRLRRWGPVGTVRTVSLPTVGA